MKTLVDKRAQKIDEQDSFWIWRKLFSKIFAYLFEYVTRKIFMTKFFGWLTCSGFFNNSKVILFRRDTQSGSLLMQILRLCRTATYVCRSGIIEVFGFILKADNCAVWKNMLTNVYFNQDTRPSTKAPWCYRMWRDSIMNALSIDVIRVLSCCFNLYWCAKEQHTI